MGPLNSALCAHLGMVPRGAIKEPGEGKGSGAAQNLPHRVQPVPGECWGLCHTCSGPAAQSGFKFTLPTCISLSGHLQHLPRWRGTSLALLTIPG